MPVKRSKDWDVQHAVNWDFLALLWYHDPRPFIIDERGRPVH